MDYFLQRSLATNNWNNIFLKYRAMDEGEQCKLLQRVIDGELSIVELKEAAADVKQLAALKLAFYDQPILMIGNLLKTGFHYLQMKSN